MSKITRVMLGFPWYAGPDKDCYLKYFSFLGYLGRLRERSLWLDALAGQQEVLKSVVLPSLDSWVAEGNETELTLEDGIFEFDVADQAGLSLPGLARERLVDMALQWGSDWIFMWDSDMLFPWSTLLKLLRHNKPVVNALGFTSRDPIVPCLYRIREGYDVASKGPTYDSEVVYDYPRNRLIGSEDIDGSIAFGAGVTLINMNVFRQLPKPWFNSTGCGEDWFFCVRCHLAGIPRYVDTSIKLKHKKYEVSWNEEGTYDDARKKDPELYAKLARREVLT